MGPELVTVTDRVPVPRSFVSSRENSRWKAYREARMTKDFYPLLDASKARRIIRMGRSTITLLVNLLTGHNNLAYHTTECPALESRRREIFLDKPPFRGATWSLASILKFAASPGLERIIGGGDLVDDALETSIETSSSGIKSVAYKLGLASGHPL